MPKILLVDDDLVYLDELSSALRDLGHDVHSSNTIEEAGLILAQEPIEAIICDTVMAGGGALSFLHNTQVTHPGIPFIAITGRPEIASSPLFKLGMREASAKIEKTADVREINQIVMSLL